MTVWVMILVGRPFHEIWGENERGATIHQDKTDAERKQRSEKLAAQLPITTGYLSVENISQIEEPRTRAKASLDIRSGERCAQNIF